MALDSDLPTKLSGSAVVCEKAFACLGTIFTSPSLLLLELQGGILQNSARFGRHQRAHRSRVLGFPRVADFLHRDPFDAFVLVDVFDDSVSIIVSFTATIAPCDEIVRHKSRTRSGQVDSGTLLPDAFSKR